LELIAVRELRQEMECLEEIRLARAIGADEQVQRPEINGFGAWCEG
jgi:hypothetical protein